MAIMSPEERWENDVEHHPNSLKVAEIIKKYDEYGDYSFGGDGDNGEELLYYLDEFFEEYSDEA